MILEKLSDARGVSGDESAVRALIAEQLEKSVDEYRIDALGNLIALKRAARKGASRAPSLKILVAAHMDEVGLLITHIDCDGYLLFEKVGGIDDRILPSSSVLVGAGGVPGVIGFKPRHRSTESERKKVVPAEDLRIDIGATSREDAARVVSPGDYVTFATQYAPFGDNCARGKALDDRAGCALLLELTREMYPFDFYAVFTTQEEIGARGARAAGFSVAPEIALVLEATVCDDLPRSREQSPGTELGAGPALTIADRGLLADKRLVRILEDTAREHRLPYQFKQPLIGGTDAGQLHRVRQGVPSAVVSIPARYIHSPAAVISLDDFANALKLLRAALPKFVGAIE
ncbi:MAG TPA: M42 family metallopeptidase [Anaerolineae bacterium]|nr:M42 family metallopeptidase [Anaerolineae bacterium]